jgi:elongation factor 2
MPKFKSTQDIIRIIDNKDQIRNFGVIAHVDHGKTTMSDSLLAASGIISPSVAGQALALDSMKLEQNRQMTIRGANVTLFYEHEGKEYVINMIDTPGHIDFTGRVTRALRAIDGVVVVSDSVEGIMTQTETVTRQALEERVRPVLYINKIDRLVKELRLDPPAMQKWLSNIIAEIFRYYTTTSILLVYDGEVINTIFLLIRNSSIGWMLKCLL